MKTALTITKTELRMLFYSPIAWFLLVIFMIQCGVNYFDIIENNATTQEVQGGRFNFNQPLTFSIFSNPYGFITSIMQNLYLYVPLLTMGLISRETSSGTIKLLYSSPIRVRDIVAGKFLAMMIYTLLMTVIVAIFVLLGIIHIDHADIGMLMSGLFGLYLLLLTYSAIGLFMSCLTIYQIVAAVCTFVMIGILTYVGQVWQRIDFVRDLTYFLWLPGRTQSLLKGLITSRDVIYFFVIIYIFLGLAILKLKSGMESKSAAVQIGRYAFVIISALTIGYVTSLPAITGYLDVRANEYNTLSVNSQKVINTLDGAPLKITVYNNILGNYAFMGMPEQRNAELERWDKYIRFKNDIQIAHVQYYDSVYGMSPEYEKEFYDAQPLDKKAQTAIKAMKLAPSEVKTPAVIRSLINLRPEMNRYTMHLQWKNKSTFLRVYDDMQVFPSETETNAALQRLVDTRIPKVLFATGHLERTNNEKGDKGYQVLTDMKSFRFSLVNQGFDCDSISISARDIPTDITALVIADPRIAFDDITMQRIRKYVVAGGNLLITGEPGRQHILNPLLQDFGTQILNGQIAQQSADNPPDLVVARTLPFASNTFKSLTQNINDSIKVTLPAAAPLSFRPVNGFTAETLVMSDDSSSWHKASAMNLDTLVRADITAAGPHAAGVLQFNAVAGDQRGAFPLVLGMRRTTNGKEQRIVVSGDADFMSNAELMRINITQGNFTFSTALFNWLSNGQYPADASRPDFKDKRVDVDTEQVDRLRIIYIWILPGILVAMATILLIRRKRK